MRNVLCTGGTGFVGHWMKVTKPANVSVTYLGREAYHEFTQLNWKHFNFDGYVHLAPVDPYYAIFGAKWNYARLLYCSSGIVYHPENDTEYRRGKIEGEAKCLNGGLDVVIARLFTFSGEKLDDGKAIVQFYKCAIAGKPLQIYGDGSTIRSYMHGYDLGKMMWAILEHGKSGAAYDVGSLVPITMLELAKFIIFTTKSKSKIEFVNKPNPMPVYLPHKDRIFYD
jgi:nucleoside-diphosphate-sugar epimerase